MFNKKSCQPFLITLQSLHILLTTEIELCLGAIINGKHPPIKVMAMKLLPGHLGSVESEGRKGFGLFGFEVLQLFGLKIRQSNDCLGIFRVLIPMTDVAVNAKATNIIKHWLYNIGVISASFLKIHALPFWTKKRQRSVGTRINDNQWWWLNQQLQTFLLPLVPSHCHGLAGPRPRYTCAHLTSVSGGDGGQGRPTWGPNLCFGPGLSGHSFGHFAEIFLGLICFGRCHNIMNHILLILHHCSFLFLGQLAMLKSWPCRCRLCSRGQLPGSSTRTTEGRRGVHGCSQWSLKVTFSEVTAWLLMR